LHSKQVNSLEHATKISRRSGRAQEVIQKDQSRRALIVNSIQVLIAVNIAAVITYRVGWENLDTHKYPVTMLLCAYVVFIMWTAYRAFRQRLKWYDLATSIALDFALCMEILLFQYANNESSLGVAPMFSYVFVMIAMRTLHFEPLMVWLAGAFAAVGWTTIVSITLIATGLSDDFGKNFKFKDLLFSGMLEKFLAIIGVTVILGYAVKEAKKYFEAAIVRAVAGQGLAKFIGNEIASKIVMAAGDLKPGQGRMARAAILMVDLKNFTQTASTMKPSAIMSMLQEYQAIVAPIIAARGGVIDKFMGDGILAHFGAVSSSPGYAADALVAIEEILFRMNQWTEARIREGKHATFVKAACAVGDVVFGTVGGGGRMEFTIIGDAVNATSKLEKYTTKMNAQAVVTGRAFDTAKFQGYNPQSKTQRYNNQQVPGVSRTVDLVVISPPLAIMHSQHTNAS
jgi:adenylate cyclase